jgi:hypothetical protein
VWFTTAFESEVYASHLGLDIVTSRPRMCTRLQVASALEDDQTVRACATLLVRNIRRSIFRATPPERVATYSSVEYESVAIPDSLPRTCMRICFREYRMGGA